MDVKVGGEEAQVCRLCGQFESIYIDVFGEEGTRRLLGLKIHSKINILIKRDDDLPKTVCIRCVGTLEYVCDFMEQCEDTQQMLLQKANPKSEDEESNKENVIRSKENCQNPPQPLEKNSKSFPLDEKILNEIQHNRNLNKENFLKQNPKLRPLGSFFGKTSNSIQKFLVETSKENMEKPEEVIKEKPVEIRPTLRKFMWNPDSYSLKAPETENLQLNHSLKEENVNSLESVPENNNQLEKGSICESEECKSAEKSDVESTKRKKKNPEEQKRKVRRIEESESLLSPQSPKTIPKNENSDDSSSAEDSPSEGSVKSSRKKRRKSGPIHGTISQLISQEDKEAIEQYYTLDMSSVDEKEVEGNLKYLNKKQTMCTICSTIYPRIDKCRVHIWGHLEMKPYKCKACDFATVTVTNIRCHIRKSHLKIKPFECNFCQKRYVTAVLLQEHLNTHSGLRPYKCKICEFSSASRQVLSYHMTTHKTVKDVTCDICGKEFFSKGRMRAHMITHNKNKELMCKYCSHHFSNSEALNKHYDNVHSKDYTCDICGKTTKSRKALHNHQNVHSEAKYKCTLCPNVYKSGHILKEHLLKHKGIRKYKCELCEKDFAQQSHLAAHMAVHSEKRFKCPGCQRAFNRHDNMKIHTKRCPLFNANPGLKDLISQRVKRSGGKEEKKSKEDFGGIEEEGGKESEAFRIGQVVVIPISSVPGDVECHDKDAIEVTESILDLECF